MVSKKISIIGVGNMGQAMLSSWITQGVLDWGDVHLFDLRKDYLKAFPKANVHDNLASCLKKGDYIFICVKPKDVEAVLEEINKIQITQKPTNKKIISIATGISLHYLSKKLGENIEVARVMPNTPLLVGAGAVAVSLSTNHSLEIKELLSTLFSAVGKIIFVKEELMDVVTGLSGSSPAFIYILIEAMSDAGVDGGLSRKDALDLAAQSVYGAAKMVLNTGENPSILKDKVTSPGGTTIAGLKILEQRGFRSAIQAAIEEATKRSSSLKK